MWNFLKHHNMNFFTENKRQIKKPFPLICESLSIPSAYGSLVDSSPQDLSKHRIWFQHNQLHSWHLKGEVGKSYLVSLRQKHLAWAHGRQWILLALSRVAVIWNRFLLQLIPWTECPQMRQTSKLQGLSPTQPTCSLHSHFWTSNIRAAGAEYQNQDKLYLVYSCPAQTQNFAVRRALAGGPQRP